MTNTYYGKLRFFVDFLPVCHAILLAEFVAPAKLIARGKRYWQPSRFADHNTGYYTAHYDAFLSHPFITVEVNKAVLIPRLHDSSTAPASLCGAKSNTRPDPSCLAHRS
jgi:hypothetical protein